MLPIDYKSVQVGAKSPNVTCVQCLNYSLDLLPVQGVGHKVDLNVYNKSKAEQEHTAINKTYKIVHHKHKKLFDKKLIWVFGSALLL